MSDLELIEEALVLAAERCGDVVPLVYEQFFRLRPEAGALFDRGAMAQGKMFNETLSILLECADDAPYLHGIVEKEVADHLGYGVLASMYPDYFEAILAAMRKAVGDQWRQEYEQAWSVQIDRLMQMVGRYTAVLRMRDGNGLRRQKGNFIDTQFPNGDQDYDHEH